MKNKILAFSLVELIVAMTISMIIMLSVWVFVSGGISNLTLQTKILDNSSNFRDFDSDLASVFSRIDTSFSGYIISNSGVLVKVRNDFDKWWFAYIWTETLSWVYCSDDSEDSETNHIFIKHFVPFEEKDEDMFTNSWAILTASWWTNYKSFAKEHVVKDNLWNIIIWKWIWIFWDEFNSEFGTGIFLNNPTWLALSGNILFVSDTLNNRVLAYNTLSSKISILLDENDWLREPTGLYYNGWELYISNSAKWEILKYSSKKEISNPDLTASWVVAWNYEIKIFLNSWSQVYNTWNTHYNWNYFTWSDITAVLSQTWSYYSQFLTWSTSKWYFPYFTQWDDDLITKTDNVLDIFTWWLTYPTGIWKMWIIQYNEFLDWTYFNLSFDTTYDILLKTPISKIVYDYQNNLLNIVLTYFKQYNCYNLDGKIERTAIYKKSF